MTLFAQEAKHSVVVLHQLIEHIFNHGRDGGDSFHLLLSHFHPDFKMVTPQGKQLNLDQVEDLFRRLQGGKGRDAHCDQ